MSGLQYKPMLAAKLKKGETYEEKLLLVNWTDGILCSPKLDGIRIFVHPELGPVSRTLKPIPNVQIRNKLAAFEKKHSLLGLDGELVDGDHEAPEYLFANTFSTYNTQDKDATNVKYYVFDDMTDPTLPFKIRLLNAKRRVHVMDDPDVIFVGHKMIYSIEALYEYEKQCLTSYYEGVMMRNPLFKYKFGRSTWREQGLMALKRFTDSDAYVVGFVALERNMNEPTVDALGLQVRSSHKANKIADELLGKFICVGVLDSDFADVQFKVGSGMSSAQREEYWLKREDLLGKLIKFKYQSVGSKNKPRAAIFLGFREDVR